MASVKPRRPAGRGESVPPVASILSEFDPDEPGATMRAGLLDSISGQLEPDADQPPAARRRPFICSLFWRTFALIGLLLLASAIGWSALFGPLKYGPRAIENTRQAASLVNLARAALTHADANARASLIDTMARQEQIRILSRGPDDRLQPLTASGPQRRASRELIDLLGPDTLVAASVNGEPGLWIGFSIGEDAYWLQMEPSRIGLPASGGAWTLALVALVALLLLAAAALARQINQPLRQLFIATTGVREGDFRERLDENSRLREVRLINAGFNRMAERVFSVERNRAEMLAGISHDLRTPLARLRLETEMSVPDVQARDLMADDIAQVDAMIDKFLDYARPGHASLQSLPLADLARACARPFVALENMRIRIDIPPDLRITGDETELSRLLSNLLENARRYGHTPGEQSSRVRISAIERNHVVTLRVRDYGTGVPPDQLRNLARPFYRGNHARTAALGTGLGLAVVAKVVQGMKGVLEFGNSPTGGLIVLIRLPQEPPRAE